MFRFVIIVQSYYGQYGLISVTETSLGNKSRSPLALNSWDLLRISTGVSKTNRNNATFKKEKLPQPMICVWGVNRFLLKGRESFFHNTESLPVFFFFFLGCRVVLAYKCRPIWGKLLDKEANTRSQNEAINNLEKQMWKYSWQIQNIQIWQIILTENTTTSAAASVK